MPKNIKQYNPAFINIEINENTVFVYSVRRALNRALNKSLNKFKGILLDLGCGEMPYKEYILDHNSKITKYIGVDIDYSEYHQVVKPDLYWDGKKIPMNDNSVDTVIATELFEHIDNIEDVLRESIRVLRKDGLLYFTVPFIWPLHETPYDQYRYTPYSLERHLKNIGFKNIYIFPTGGYNAALAQIICIWTYNTRLAIKKLWKRKIFVMIEKLFIYNLIKFLVKRDEWLDVTTYSENTMPTGFYAYATK